MILEVAILNVVAGRESEFEAAFADAQRYLRSIDGYLSHELRHCTEVSNRYILLVQWRKLEDHTKGFRNSPQYQHWRKALHPFYDPFPTVEHYRLVEAGTA